MKKLPAAIWDELLHIWEDYLHYLHAVMYVVVVIFLILGVMAAFTGAPELGIFLIVLNALILVLMIRLDKAADADFDKDFQEMVRQNLEDQNPTGGRRTK